MLKPIVVLVFGGNGWIGSKVVKLLQKSNTTVIKSTCRADDINAIQKEITDILELYREYYHLKDHVPPMKILEEYNIQKYPLKGAFNKIHCDRGYIPNVNNNRELVFMTYLNDVHTGGETEFMFYNLKIKPQKGLTLVWPAGWTHLHRGLPSPTTEKMIVTGWYSYEQ